MDQRRGGLARTAKLLFKPPESAKPIKLRVGREWDCSGRHILKKKKKKTQSIRDISKKRKADGTKSILL